MGPDIGGSTPPNDASCYGTLLDYIENCSNKREGLDENSLVRVVRFVIGGSSSWQNFGVRVTSQFDNLIIGE